MEPLLCERREEGAVAVVTLNRPEVLNAFNTATAEALRDVFQQLRDDDALRAVVITGAGDRAFCAGADLKERDGMTDEAWMRQHRIFQDAFRAVRECPVPTIAAVDGYALGGGCELALTCDLIVASERAVFGLPEVSRGIMPGLGATQYLPRLVGRSRAKELMFTGRRWSAQEAFDWGMVCRLTPPGDALAEALSLAQTIAQQAPIAVRQVKRAVDLGADLELHTALELALEAYAVLIPTEDRREGVRAFAEKRPPRFRNR